MQAKKLVPILAAVSVAAALLILWAPIAGAGQYRIKAGDTLSAVATRTGVSVQALASANGISNPNVIVAGQMLSVPSSGGSTTEYLVRKGDTLAGISAKVGVPVDDLMKANGLLDRNWVGAGMILTIPPVGAILTAGPIDGGGTGSAGSYTVQPGDTLSSIATKLGIPVAQLAASNHITNPNLIVVGQVLGAPGAWLCPVPSATFVNDYGYAEAGGGKHEGIDMFAAKGTAIQAPVGGRVDRYPNNLGGNAIELYGNDGNRYYFAHLNAYGATGQVSAGTTVGYVGTTGDAEGKSPHLHFEIHPGGGASVNPYPTLVAACR